MAYVDERMKGKEKKRMKYLCCKTLNLVEWFINFHYLTIGLFQCYHIDAWFNINKNIPSIEMESKEAFRKNLIKISWELFKEIGSGVSRGGFGCQTVA